MKKVVVFLIILILISNVYAITLSEVTEDNVKSLSDEEVINLLVEYNSLSQSEKENYISKFNSWNGEDKNFIKEKLNILEESSLKEQFLLVKDEINENIEIPKIPFVFPLKIGINVKDTKEEFVLEVSKTGLDISEKKPDIIIAFNSNELDFRNFDLFTVIEKYDVKANSVKGAFVLNVFEEITKKKIVKERTLGYKFMGILAKPVALFVKDVEIN